jgi:hypothetical protein
MSHSQVRNSKLHGQLFPYSHFKQSMDLRTMCISFLLQTLSMLAVRNTFPVFFSDYKQHTKKSNKKYFNQATCL